MDFQNRVGGKTGMGGVASWSEANRDRKDRAEQMALATIDPSKDPYFFRNNVGQYECKLCKTCHNTIQNYALHTQAKRHSSNLSIRNAQTEQVNAAQPALAKQQTSVKYFVQIGKPGYNYTYEFDEATGRYGLLFQIEYPEIADGVKPMYRIMSGYEQKCEPRTHEFQYLIFAAEPYSNICFKIPNKTQEKDPDFFAEWNPATKQYFFQIPFSKSPQ